MNDCVSTLRLHDAWRECQRHAYHLRRAFHLPGAILPMTGSRFENLSDEQIQTSISDFLIRMECPMALCRSAILALDKLYLSRLNLTCFHVGAALAALRGQARAYGDCRAVNFNRAKNKQDATLYSTLELNTHATGRL